MINSEQREALHQAILRGPAYRLAHADAEFLAEDDLRAVRLQLEQLKPERELRAQGISSTVVVVGSARIRAADDMDVVSGPDGEQMDHSPFSFIADAWPLKTSMRNVVLMQRRCSSMSRGTPDRIDA